MTEWQGFRVLPPVREVAGCDVLAEVYRREKADLLLTLCDPFRLVGIGRDLARMNVAHWFPVDCSPVVGRRRGGPAGRPGRPCRDVPVRGAVAPLGGR